ncbi:MAG: hypothetical protein U9R37_02490 [Campylobacterota bacterium]|nr:hypothetical protein [Campylobacterota bacterium]
MNKVLKDWYVNFEVIETDKKTYKSYLLSKVRHPKQEISELTDSDNPLKMELDQMWYREKYQSSAKERKAINGRDITISLPENVGNQLNDNEWKNMYKSVFGKMYKTLIIDNQENFGITDISDIDKIVNDLVEKCYVVRHKKDHIHTIVPTLYFNEDMDVNFVFNRYISKKKYSYLVKKELDNWLLSNKGISKSNYYTSQYNTPAKRKNVSEKYEDLYNEFLKQEEIITQKENDIKDLSNEVESLSNELGNQINEISTVKNELQEMINNLQNVLNEIMKEKQVKNSHLEQVQKQILRGQKQLDNENTNRAQKTLEKVDKTLTKFKKQ